MSLIEFHSPSGTLAMFDPSVLKHRLLDPRGWWQDEQQALREMRHGRLAIVDLGLPGTYLVSSDRVVSFGMSDRPPVRWPRRVDHWRRVGT